MLFHLPALPFAPNALEPHISRETIEIHYGKHHQAYVDKVNALKSDDADSLEDIVRSATGELFHNAAQAWNHTFYWHSLRPEKANMRPSGALAEALEASFGGMDPFLEKFTTHAAEVFGSGWTWLVRDDRGTLSVVSTQNAGTPLLDGQVPLLVADVWEHAYYIDYRNDRKAHLASIKGLLNWRFAADRFEAAEPFLATAEMQRSSAA